MKMKPRKTVGPKNAFHLLDGITPYVSGYPLPRKFKPEHSPGMLRKNSA